MTVVPTECPIQKLDHLFTDHARQEKDFWLP
jgi:hypothetical protein